MTSSHQSHQSSNVPGVSNASSVAFPFVTAQYRSHGLAPEHVGNPYIEALFSPPDDRSLARALHQLPAFSPDERTLSPAMRIQLTARLRRLFIAGPRVVEFARSVLTMLYAGYEGRAPYTAGEKERLDALYAQQQSGEFSSVRHTRRASQHSFALIGASGAGKSSAIRHIAALFPPVIYHAALGRWQVPFAFIEMPYDGKSAHTLASTIAEEFDRLMPDGQFVDTFMRKGKANAEERVLQMLRVAYQLGLGMLVVDESQNQQALAEDEPRSQRRKATRSSASVETPLMKLLITASNLSQMPILFVGTTEMRSVVGTRFTKARRTSGRGTQCWFAHLRSPEKITGEFEVLLQALFRYQWTTQVISYSEEWANLFHEHSQGITDILVKLWESCQVEAISSGEEEVTPELLRRVFKKEFVMAEFGLTALKNEDPLMLAIVSDVTMPRIEVEKFTRSEYPLPSAASPIGAAKPAKAAKEVDEASSKAKPATTKPTSPAKKRREPPSPTPEAFDASMASEADLRGASVNGESAEALAKLGVSQLNEAM